MMEFPGLGEGTWQYDEVLAAAPTKTDWQKVSTWYGTPSPIFISNLQSSEAGHPKSVSPGGFGVRLKDSGTMRYPL